MFVDGVRSNLVDFRSCLNRFPRCCCEARFENLEKNDEILVKRGSRTGSGGGEREKYPRVPHPPG